MSLNTLAFLLLQLCHNDLSKDRCSWASRSVVHYLTQWASRTRLEWWSPSQEQYFQNIHIRYFEMTHGSIAQVNSITPFGGTSKEIPIPREEGVYIHHKLGFKLREVRTSFAIVTEFKTETPCFTIIVLAEGLHYLPSGIKRWDVGQSCFSGMHLYINAIFHGVDNACRQWDKVLTNMDGDIKVSVSLRATSRGSPP